MKKIPAHPDGMNGSDTNRRRSLIQQIVLGLIAVVFVTLAGFGLNFNYATVGFLDLVVVMVVSLAGSFVTSAIVSLIAAILLEFFFIPPRLSLRIKDPRDVLAFCTSLFASLVITRLASTARAQTLAAERRGRDLAMLFDTASQLLALEPQSAAANCPRIFRDVFGLDAVCLFDAATAQSFLAGSPSTVEGDAGLTQATREAFLAGQSVIHHSPEILTYALQVAGKTIGAIGFEGTAPPVVVTGALSLLAASTMERAANFERSVKAGTEMRAEELRSAVLDAFAHEFKTPLTAILAAAGGLDAVGNLNEQQRQLTELIESESSRLGLLTGRLLRMARLDHAEVMPRLQTVDLYSVVTEVARHRVGLLLTERVFVMADPELLTMALMPLLDNALKYSTPGSSTLVEIGEEDEYGVMQIHSRGAPIEPDEAQSIFERFYRGRRAEKNTAGTGLGLYIARKIVVAHGGTLTLEQKRAGMVTFCMRLPLAPTKGTD